MIRRRKVGSAMERFEGSNYGIELSQSIGFQVTAGKAKWVLFVKKRSAEDGIIKSINRNKTIMGLLSRWVVETGEYQPQYVVLTNPVEDGQVQIMVVRSDGEVFYSGKAAVKRNILSFIMSDIKRPGTAPTKVKGKLTLRGVQLEVTIPSKRREGKRSPTPLTPEEFYERFPHLLE
jgi:hypothetical protein